MKIKYLLLLAAAALTLSACRSEAHKLNRAGNDAFAAHEYDAALENYQSASAEDPSLAAPVYNRANVYYRQAQFDDAGAALRTAMLRSNTALTQKGHFNLGNTLFNKGDYAGAVEAYKQALRLDPNDMDAKVNLELTLEQLQNQQDQENQDQQDEQQQEDQPQDQQEQQDDSQGGQSDQNQEQNSDQNDPQQDQPSGDSQQEDNPQDQQSGDQSQPQDESQNGDQSQQPEPEQPGQEEQDAGQGDQQEQQDQPPGDQQQDQNAPPAGEPEQPPPPQQAGASGADAQAEVQMAPGQPMQLEGLTEEQARQLLIAASQGTETLQEYLQQIYVFPYSDVENDW